MVVACVEAVKCIQRDVIDDDDARWYSKGDSKFAKLSVRLGTWHLHRPSARCHIKMYAYD